MEQPLRDLLQADIDHVAQQFANLSRQNRASVLGDIRTIGDELLESDLHDRDGAPENRVKPRRYQDFIDADWEKIASFYARVGIWMRDAGPDPMHVGRCRCPISILEKHGIDPATGEKTRGRDAAS
jgi:hypothetical protein